MRTLSVKRDIILSNLTILIMMLLISGLQGISYGQGMPDKIVQFSDVNLAKAVRRALRLPIGDDVDLLRIPKAELEKLTELNANDKEINDLTGLEHASQLTNLYLGENNISDITPLAQLTQLRKLNLEGYVTLFPSSRDYISDITPLAQLTQLVHLVIAWNEINDVTPLAQLTQLEYLDLTVNEISDVTPLAQLTQLVELKLGSNQMSDITPLAELTQLKALYLGNNDISDVKPLTQLTQLEELSLRQNNISDITPLAQLTRLEKLYLRQNDISDLTPLAQLTQLTEIKSDHFEGPASKIRLIRISNLQLTEAMLNGGSVTLTLVSSILSYHRSINTIKATVTVSGIDGVTVSDIIRANDSEIEVKLAFRGNLEHSATLSFSVGAEAISGYVGHVRTLDTTVYQSLVEFADVNLAEAVRKALGLPTGNGVDLLQVPKAALTELTKLDVVRTTITDLTGLEHATQLERLTLQENKIDDVTFLTQLSQLTELNLSINQISDITPLAQLTGLTALQLWKNQISDITPLVQLTQLTELRLSENQIQNVTPLGQLTQLRTLTLNKNQIQDITPLAGLANLQELKLKDNPISNSYPLSSLLDENPDLEIDIEVIRKPLIASTEAKLAEKQLDGSVVTLTLHLGVYAPQNIVENGVTVSGINGVTIATAGVTRVDDTQVTVRLEFDGPDIHADKTLTFSVAPNAISDYSGNALTADILIDGYMQGPWLWMAVPTGAEDENDVFTEFDSLAAASDRFVTEADIAQNGVNEGDTVGRLEWREDVIASTAITCREFCSFGILQWHCTDVCWENNLDDTLNRVGFGTGDNITVHTAYALVYLVSPRNQNGTMQVLSGDTVKIWLNGEVVHRHAATQLPCRKVDIPYAFDSQDCTPDPRIREAEYVSFPVTLQAGNNLLLVKVRQHGDYWGMRLKLDADVSTSVTPETPITDATLSISPSSVVSPAIGDRLTINLNIAGGENIAGYQATIQFDGTALRYSSSDIGDYLPAGAFPLPAIAAGNRITLGATSRAGESDGDGTLAAITFEIIAMKESALTLSDVLLSNSAGTGFRPQVEGGQIIESWQSKGDINGDGIVNILDLVLVAGRIGQSGQNGADVNGDGTVNILDLVLVAVALGNVAAAPSTWYRDLEIAPTRTDVEGWLAQAQTLDLTDATSQRGVFFLRQLLAALTPRETVLLPNYPNPFNPETWIPYHLARNAEVQVAIYDAGGSLVRQLNLGHQLAGFYAEQTSAAYWDGRNERGESVASGLYFYTLTAGGFSATRKMLIMK